MSKRTRTDPEGASSGHYKSEDRDGSSSGHSERNINFQACNLMTCNKTLKEGMQQVLDHLTNTGSKLKETSIYKRCENFGKKGFLKSTTLINAWTSFCRSKKSNRGNTSARGLTTAQKASNEAKFQDLLKKVNETMEENADNDDNVEIKVWIKFSNTDKEKKLAMEWNSETNQPNYTLENHLQLPFAFDSLRRKLDKHSKTSKNFKIKLRQHEDLQFKETKPMVTRNDYQLKLATIVVSRK